MLFIIIMMMIIIQGCGMFTSLSEHRKNTEPADWRVFFFLNK